MTIETLKFIDEQLNNNGINYEFSEWSKAVPDVYFVGEFTEVANPNEGAENETSFLLTGTTSDSWLTLMECKEIIEGLFPRIGGKIAKLKDGLTVAIFFENAIPVPTDTMDLKRIQVNLKILEMKGI